MMRKYSKLLTFLIAFSMILSMHVTFAEPEGSAANQVNNWINYFDEDGSKGLIGMKYEPVDTPWEVVDPPVGYEYYAIIVKAGSDESTDGQSNKVITGGIEVGDEIYFTWDDDGVIKHKNISHIIAIFVPIEELDPVGSITISKTLVDEQEQEITDDSTEFEFMIEMYDDDLDEWNEIQASPVFLEGGESETLDDLPLGTYRITEDEDLPDGYSRVSSLFVEVTLNDDGDSEDADFINMREEDTPPPPVGEIVISKTLIDEQEQVITDDSTEFEFMIEMYDDDLDEWNEIQASPVFLEGGESETLDDLPLGTYRVTEDEDLPDGYSRVSSLFVDVTLNDDGDSEDADFTNMREEDTPPPPELGEIVISKTLIDEQEQEITDDSTEFEFMIEMYDDDLDEWNEIQASPVFLEGGESETLDDLPLGTYRITEDEDLPDGYSRVSSLFVEVTLNDDGDSEDADFINMREEDTPPPPELGEIVISKTLVDEQEQEITDDSTEFEFMIEMYDDDLDEWNEIQASPVFLEGGESETLDDLPLGTYRITEDEDLPDGYSRVSSLFVEVTLNDDGDSEDADFTNMREEDTPPPPEEWEGTIRIEKSVRDSRDDDPELDGFTFRLFLIESEEEISAGVETTDEDGIAEFTGLEEGEYILYEDNESGYVEGINSNGFEINLSPEETEDDVLVITVVNRRTYPPRRDEPEEPEQEEPSIVITEVLPETIIEPEPEVPQPEPEVETVEEPMPLATLPKTGASDPTLFAGLGAAFMALGLFLKKKRF